MDKYQNGRKVFRRKGKFSKPPTLKEMGVDVSDPKANFICECGYDKKTRTPDGKVWQPLIATWKCDNCGKQNRN